MLGVSIQSDTVPSDNENLRCHYYLYLMIPFQDEPLCYHQPPPLGCQLFYQ